MGEVLGSLVSSGFLLGTLAVNTAVRVPESVQGTSVAGEVRNVRSASARMQCGKLCFS